MRVRCLDNRAATLPKSTWRHFAGSKDTEWRHFQPGAEYVVSGVCVLADGVVGYFLDAFHWMPADHFEIAHNGLDGGWLCDYRGRSSATIDTDVVALFGYKEMIEDPDHIADLTFNLGTARDTFAARRREEARTEFERRCIDVVREALSERGARPGSPHARTSLPYIIQWGDAGSEDAYDSMLCVEVDAEGARNPSRISVILMLDGCTLDEPIGVARDIGSQVDALLESRS